MLKHVKNLTFSYTSPIFFCGDYNPQKTQNGCDESFYPSTLDVIKAQLVKVPHSGRMKPQMFFLNESWRVSWHVTLWLWLT